MLINLSEVLSEPHRSIEENVIPDMKEVCIGRDKFPVDKFSPLHISKSTPTGSLKLPRKGSSAFISKQEREKENERLPGSRNDHGQLCEGCGHPLYGDGQPCGPNP